MNAPILFDPPFPMPYIIGGGVALAALAAACYWRTHGAVGVIKRVILTLLRVVAVAGLVVVLLRPMKPQPQPVANQKPVFTVLVDASGSMNTPDVGTNARLRAVTDRLRADQQSVLGELAQRYDVQFAEFAESLQPVTLDQLLARTEAKGTKTDIAAALFSVGSGSGTRKKSGILLISDGRENTGGAVDQAATYLKAQKVPVWTTTIGAATETKDVAVIARLSQNFMFARQPAAVQVDIAQSGYDNWYAKVNLYREDKYQTTRQVILKAGSTKVEFPIREERKGVFKYAVTVEPLAGEADRDNNRRALFARVVDEKPKVLLVEAEPYWDSKFLQRTLRADPNLEVTSIFQLNPTKAFAIRERTSPNSLEKEVVSAGPVENPAAMVIVTNAADLGRSIGSPMITLPQTKDELDQYDCLILGRGVDQALTAGQMKLLKDYLTDRGGSIVFARGRAYANDSPELASLEPVVWDAEQIREARFELTTEGRLSPIFAFGHPQPSDTILRELPPMVSITRILKEKSLAVILAKTRHPERNEEIAVIAYQRYGRGKVMSIGTAGLWRWSFIPEDLKEYDDVYKLFWGQMIRWLIDESDFLPGQDISFRTDRYSYSLGEKIRFMIRTKQVDPATYHPVIQLTGVGDKPVALTPAPAPDAPGVLTAYFTPEREGEFQAVLQNNVGQPREDTARFTVYSDSTENRFVAVDRDLMGRIARTTGGEEIPLENLQTLPAKVHCFELLSRDKVKPKDAWDTLPIFAALVGALTVEWFLRRRWGFA